MKILVFGRMADIVGARQLDRPNAAATLFALRDEVFGAALVTEKIGLADIRMSVNQVQVFADQSLTADDEIAFFPVFSGG